MQHSFLLNARQRDSQRMLERIDRLQSLLRERQQALSAQVHVVEQQLARLGLDTAEKIAAAHGPLEASTQGTLQARSSSAPTMESSSRATAYRRIGRLV